MRWNCTHPLRPITWFCVSKGVSGLLTSCAVGELGGHFGSYSGSAGLLLGFVFFKKEKKRKGILPLHFALLYSIEPWSSTKLLHVWVEVIQAKGVLSVLYYVDLRYLMTESGELPTVHNLIQLTSSHSPFQPHPHPHHTLKYGSTKFKLLSNLTTLNRCFPQRYRASVQKNGKLPNPSIHLCLKNLSPHLLFLFLTPRLSSFILIEIEIAIKNHLLKPFNAS